MTLIGILSDTHIQSPDDHFRQCCSAAFDQCEVILHAGDLTDISILSVFKEKKVYGVHGNMCNSLTNQALPPGRRVVVNGYSIGISHGAGPRHNIEDRVLQLFPDVDCIVYGHSHRSVCHYFGSTLMINPGSFTSTGRYGAPGTYALLEAGKDGLKGSIHSL